MLLWHLGGSVALVRYAFRDERMDLRFLLLGAVLPDLIDTPIGLAAYRSLGGVRLVAHTLVFAALAMVIVLVSTRRGRPRKRWMPLAVGVLVHLILDAMWADPETLWWPFLGWDFSAAEQTTAGGYLRAVLTDWRVWTLEAVGVVYLGHLARRANLASPATRRAFLSTGRIDVPIDST
jgi:membrane-bound metal-dependent hydrolase YbcI (DUF457 family)